MGSKNVLTKLLAVIGTILVWVPLLAMLLFAAIGYLQTGQFTLDYLLPEELLPISLPTIIIGGLLLIWAALRAHKRRAIIAISLVVAVILIISSNVIAAVSGLASGVTAPAGLPYYLTLGGIIGFDIALVVIGNEGISLIRDVFKRAKVSSIPSSPEGTTPNPPEPTPTSAPEVEPPASPDAGTDTTNSPPDERAERE